MGKRRHQRYDGHPEPENETIQRALARMMKARSDLRLRRAHDSSVITTREAANRLRRFLDIARLFPQGADEPIMMPSNLLFELSRLFVAEAKVTRNRVERERLNGVSSEVKGRGIAAMREETKARKSAKAIGTSSRRASSADGYAALRSKNRRLERPQPLGGAWR